MSQTSLAAAHDHIPKKCDEHGVGNMSVAGRQHGSTGQRIAFVLTQHQVATLDHTATSAPVPYERIATINLCKTTTKTLEAIWVVEP